MSVPDELPARTARRWLTAATAFIGLPRRPAVAYPVRPAHGRPGRHGRRARRDVGPRGAPARRVPPARPPRRDPEGALSCSGSRSSSRPPATSCDSSTRSASPRRRYRASTSRRPWRSGRSASRRSSSIPLSPPAPGARWRIATDVTIAVLGMSLAVVALWTLPGIRVAPPSAHHRLILYNAMEAANLVVLNLILVRGPLRPIRRAIFWLVGDDRDRDDLPDRARIRASGARPGTSGSRTACSFVDYLGYLYAGSVRSSSTRSRTATLRSFRRASGPSTRSRSSPCSVWGLS